jgi:hypothetical protein
MIAWQREGFRNLNYLKFVATPKAKTAAGKVLSRQLRWRLFRIRVKLRLELLLRGEQSPR